MGTPQPATSSIALYRWMIVCRELEETLCALNDRWFPAFGEEATVVGSFCDLRPTDVAAPHYRGPFVVYLMRGAEMWRLMAQALGKAAGYNKGRSVPFNGPFDANIVPWVAGDLGTSLGVATGAALACLERGSGDICVCSFGDGTANRGDFHESLNLASLWKLPIVYVCQNNGWAISQPASSYLSAPVAARSAGYGMPGASVDGNDAEAVRDAVAEAINRARAGGGPTLIEALTHRGKGHWAADHALYRHESVLRGAADPPRTSRFPADRARRGHGFRRGSTPGQCSRRCDGSRGTSASGGGRGQSRTGAGRGVRMSARPEASAARSTARLTHKEAIIRAIAEEMRRDERVFYMGQDAGIFGGAMQGTAGLFEEFGARRVRETPISESAMVGIAIGAALFGRRPIVEISFGEFLPAAMNQLVNQAPNLHYMTGGMARVPVVIRSRVGDGPYGGHPQDYSAWFTHFPGLKVVMPATPADAKGLMTTAIRDDSPVLVLEPMSLSNARREEVPDGEYLVPIGSAAVARPGRDVTVVAIGSMVPVALQAARSLESEQIDAEVIDLRSLTPWDRSLVLASTERTRRLVIVHEAWVSGGVGAEVAAAVAESIPHRLLGDWCRIAL